MEMASCLTTACAILACLGAIFGVASTDFSRLTSKLMDFKFKEVSFDLFKLAPVPVAIALVFVLSAKEVSVGNTKLVTVVSCKDKTEAVVQSCSLCSLADKVALK